MQVRIDESRLPFKGRNRTLLTAVFRLRVFHQKWDKQLHNAAMDTDID